MILRVPRQYDPTKRLVLFRRPDTNGDIKTRRLSVVRRVASR